MLMVCRFVARSQMVPKHARYKTRVSLWYARQTLTAVRHTSQATRSQDKTALRPAIPGTIPPKQQTMRLRAMCHAKPPASQRRQDGHVSFATLGQGKGRGETGIAMRASRRAAG